MSAPFGTQLFTAGCEPSMDVRYHLHLDSRRLVLFGDNPGFVFEENHWLVRVGQTGYRPCDSGPFAGVGDPEIREWPTHVPFGSGMPIHLP